jgi:hypothetical protein
VPRLIPVLMMLSLIAVANGQSAEAKPAPDVLVFQNGDQLTGKLERVAGGNAIFASDMAGEVTISLDKIKELKSGAQFALLSKGAPVTKKSLQPIGTVLVADKKVEITPAGQAPITKTADDVAYLVDKATYEQQMLRKAGFKDGWNGSLTGGATLVRSTTQATTLTAGVNLVRALPTVAWLPPRNRTTIDVQETYGKNTSPGAIPQTNPPTPPVTTLSSIFHADAERDEYISPRFYVLADTSFDHNYAQGLQFQQVYGGGVGWTPIKSDKQQLDLKVDVHYEKQAYITTPVNGTVISVTTPSVNIIGSTIFEGYRRNLPRKLLFTETANILPAFNNTNAYSANVTASLSIPVFKRLSASISTTDNFLNDPAPGYQKNSYQFVTGVTYLLR